MDVFGHRAGAAVAEDGPDVVKGAVAEGGADGGLEAGDLLRIWLQFEVDPTNVGKRSYSFELDDEDRLLARIPRTIRVLP